METVYWWLSGGIDVEDEVFGLYAFLGLLRLEGYRSSYYFLSREPI